MTAVYYDTTMTDDERRSRLFSGDLFVYSQQPSVRNFAAFARSLISETFDAVDPERAQYSMDVGSYAALLGELKPRFIHHPESKRLIQCILAELGCDLGMYYFDVPRLRSSTSDNFLTSGIAYAWHPHRDTWYSAPQCQINWWMPVFELSADNTMAFHPAYWHRPVKNNSELYNYYEWNRLYRGAEVARITKEDPRPLPRAIEALEVEPQLRLVCPVGGIIMFSAAQMHSSVPNTSGKTRFSIDFRTVHIGDAKTREGAPKTDEYCTGTTMRDYLGATDLERLPADVIALYDDDTAAEGSLVFEPGDIASQRRNQ